MRTAAALTVACAGLAMFSRGFFPQKPLIPGHAQPLSPADSVTPLYDRLVVMVVDALRADFVLDTGAEHASMPFTQSLIVDGRALAMRALATAPTVTMPRLKALTTGSPPNFLDVLSNVDSGATDSLLHVDSWLYQLRYTAGKRLHLYGDNTWLKLFPGYFAESDGTTSFFVQDTVEVDRNVTRNLDRQLAADSKWDVMILHYLGVDHIGHLAGPYSPKMRPKLREMDVVVQRIYDSLPRRTLFILCGDHGMTEVGNHGGSSLHEVTSAFVFMDPTGWTARKWLNGTNTPVVNQVDLVPTLSALFGVPLPLNSLGRFIAAMLPLWSDGDQVKVLTNNARQVMNIVDSSGIGCTSGPGPCLQEMWQQALSMKHVKIDTLLQVIELATDKLEKSFTQYDNTSMAVGLVLLLCASVLATMIARSFGRSKYSQLASAPLLYSCAMFSSSFVEEEHEIWYFFSNTFWLAMLWQRFSANGTVDWSLVGQMCIVRLAYSWNQGGIEHAGLGQDFRSWAALSDEMLATWIPIHVTRRHFLNLVIVLVSICSQFLAIRSCSLPVSWVQAVALFASACTVTLYKIEYFFNLSTAQAGQIVWATLLQSGLVFTARLWSRKCTRHEFCWVATSLAMQVALLLSRSHNAAFVVLSWIYIYHLVSADVDPFIQMFKLVSTIHLAFFMYGNSNSIATIDLSMAYIGLDGFSYGLNGLLTFASNWIGPLLVVTLYTLRQLDTTPDPWLFLAKNARQLTVWRIWSLTVAAVSVTTFREHLFVWSVFSPKFLYEVVWFAGFHGVSVSLMAIICWAFSFAVPSRLDNFKD